MGRSRGFSITQQTSKTLWKTSIIKQRLEKWMQCEKNRATFLFFFIVWYIPTIDAKTGFAYKIPFSRTQQTKWFRSNSYFWSSFCKPFHYWRNNLTEVRYSCDTVVENQRKISFLKMRLFE